jgi:23S rRNA pseudouridine2457 synthase
MVLTDNGQLQQRIANPKHKLWKTYLVQVEGTVDAPAIAQLGKGVMLKDGPTRPARCKPVQLPSALWPRVPPVRERKTVTDSWLELSIQEGRNRQIRRMTAAVGFPTLRLIRMAVGDWQLDDLQPGESRELRVQLRS